MDNPACLSPAEWIALQQACQNDPEGRTRRDMERFLLALKRAPQAGKGRACEEAGLSLPTFNKWYKAFVAGGSSAQALRFAVARRSHGQATPDAVKEQVYALAAKHPRSSCNELAAMLREHGTSISGVTVRNILRGHPHQRDARAFIWLGENEAARVPSPLLWRPKDDGSPFLESEKPPPPTPRELGAFLIQGVFFVRFGFELGLVLDSTTRASSPTTGPLYGHAIVDERSGTIWHRLCPRQEKNGALTLLQEVCEEYARRGIAVEKVTTSGWREFLGSGRRSAFGEFLVERGIEHGLPDAADPLRHSPTFHPAFHKFAESARVHFFAPWMTYQRRLIRSNKGTDDFEMLKARLDRWVKRYNDSLF